MPDLTWRPVWRALLPHYGTRGLHALARALARDDLDLCEGATALPVLGRGLCTGACPGAYPIWQNGVTDAGEVEKAFGRLGDQINADLAEHAGRCVPIAVFMEWWDYQEVPRKRKRKMLLAEVRRELLRRERMWLHA